MEGLVTPAGCGNDLMRLQTLIKNYKLKMGTCLAVTAAKPPKPRDNFKCLYRSYSFTRLNESSRRAIESGLQEHQLKLS